MSEYPTPQKMNSLMHLMGLGPDKKRHSAQEVADIVEVKLSTVKTSIQWGIDHEIICRRGSRNHPTYVKGPKFFILEEYEKRGCAMAMSSKDIVMDYYYSIHCSGRFPSFAVKKEGNTSMINLLTPEERSSILDESPDTDPSDLCTKLFDMDKPTLLKGSLEYRTSLTLSKYGDKRYILTYRKCKTPYIAVYLENRIMVSPDTAKDVGAMTKEVIRACTPLLNVLSKNGWEFEKDECGNYVLRQPLKDGHFHRVIEGPISQFILDNSPEKYGNPQSRVSIDSSPGDREVEFYSGNMIEMLDQLTDLYKRVERLESDHLGGDGVNLEKNLKQLQDWESIWAELINAALENADGNRLIFFPNQLNIYLIRGEK